MRAFLAAITTGTAIVLAGACCSSGGTEGTTAPVAPPTVVSTTGRTVVPTGVPTAAPTPAPTAASVASPSPPAADQLVVYTKQVRMTNAYLPRYPFEIDTYDIVTYDVGADSRLSSFQVDKPPGPPSDITLVGDKIAVNLKQRVVLYNVDGSGASELRAAPPQGSILSVAASPDGTKLALAEQTGPLCDPKCRPYAQITSLVFLDVASGQELLVMPQSSPAFATFRGQADGLTWRDDGSGIVVQGSTASESPGGTATVLLDGWMRTHDLRGSDFVAPNGRYAAHGFDLGCENVSGHGVSLRDLDSEVDLASVHDDSLVFEPGEWSPDSTGYLYSTYATQPSASQPPCLQEYVQGSFQWHLLRIDGSPPLPVPDPEALRDQWYGAARPRLLCGDRVVLYPYCTDERGATQAVDLYFGDTKVDSGTDIQILGYVQQPNM